VPTLKQNSTVVKNNIKHRVTFDEKQTTFKNKIENKLLFTTRTIENCSGSFHS